MTSDPGPARRRRLAAALALAVVIAAGLLVHALLPDTAATDIAGDALYGTAVYVGVVLLVPRMASIGVGAIALGWCVAVELFQLTGVPMAVGGVFPPAMLLLGTVFDARDLLVYGVTVMVVCATDLLLRRRRR